MKKLLLIMLVCAVHATFTSVEIKDTGMYQAHVESMPFFRFWNRPKATKLIAEFMDSILNSKIKSRASDTESAQWDGPILLPLDGNDFPIIITFDKAIVEQMYQLQTELKALGCEFAVNEMTYIVEDNDPLAIMKDLSRINKKFEQAMAELPRKDDGDATKDPSAKVLEDHQAMRKIFVRVLQEDLAENFPDEK